MGNMKDANLIMDEIKKQAEAKHPEFSESDLIQFTSYLLETLVALLDLLRLLLVFYCYLKNFDVCMIQVAEGCIAAFQYVKS